MTEVELLAKPRYFYEVADFFGCDKRTLLQRLKECGYDFGGGGFRLLLPYQVRRILDIVRGSGENPSKSGFPKHIINT